MSADRIRARRSIYYRSVHPHDVAQILDWEGVAIRAGHAVAPPFQVAALPRSPESTGTPRSP